MRNSRIVANIVSAVGALVLAGSPQLAAAADVPCNTGNSTSGVWSCATGVYVRLSLLNLVNAGIGPVANAYGTAPAPYAIAPHPVSLGAAAGLTNLGVGSLGVTAGLITDTASSSYAGGVTNLSATATSTVANLGINLVLSTILGPVTVLGITAPTLTATSTASRIDGGRVQVLSGTSAIENLAISLAGVAIPVSAHITAATPANTELLPVADQSLGLSVIANYQTPIYGADGVSRVGIQTAALAIEFNNFLLGTGALNGEVLIADTAAAVPEPGAWAMMLAGFGLIGAIVRRRRGIAFA